MPFSARMSSVRTVSVMPGLSQPRGALPVLLPMTETLSLISARSSASVWALRMIELVTPWPIHSQRSLLPASMICGYSRQTSEFSATLPRTPNFCMISISRQMPTRTP